MTTGLAVDVVVVGAGLTGLAHAYAATTRGLRVALVEQDAGLRTSAPTWSGLISDTARHPHTPEFADHARAWWERVATKVGIDVARRGSIMLARSQAETAVIEEFSRTRPDARSRTLTEGEVAAMAGGPIADLTVGLLLPHDAIVNPREAEPALQRWLEDSGASFHWGTHVAEIATRGAEKGPVRVVTSSGTIIAEAVVHCAGYDIDRLFPDLARASDSSRCDALAVEVAGPPRYAAGPALLTGSSMLTRAGLAMTASADLLFEEFASETPEFLRTRMDLTVVARPDGELFIGSTHSVDARTHRVGDVGDVQLLVRSAEVLLGAPLRVQRTWAFSHAALDSKDLFVGEPGPRVRVVTMASESCSSNIFDVADAVLSTLS